MRRVVGRFGRACRRSERARRVADDRGRFRAVRGIVPTVKRRARGWAVGVAVAVAAAGAAPAASADELEFAVGQGRVTLIAAGVPLRDVLAAWARAGNTRFVGAEAIGASPVSLHLVDVAEREALRLLLRPAAGYLAARRAAPVAGASIYDRVKVRAARRAPREAPADGTRRPALPPPGPVREAPPALTEADQRERLQRLLRPPPAGGAAPGRAADAPRAGAVYAPTTPRPGMIVEAEPREQP